MATLAPSQIRCKRQAACRLFTAGVCIYNHDEELTGQPVAGLVTQGQRSGKGKGKGKGAGFQQQQSWAVQPAFSYDMLPASSKPVTLFGENGFFIPTSAIQGGGYGGAAAAPAWGQQGMKRPAQGGAGNPAGMGSKGLHPSQVPCKRGADCRLFSQGVCIYNHDAEGGPTPPTPEQVAIGA